MKKENTSIRLRFIMQQRSLRQIDILNACMPYCQQYDVKMNKSDISQYVSGKVEPNQDKLYILGKALNVNEAWLMGYDVPMERNIVQSSNESPVILRYYEQLNELGKQEAEKRVEELTYLPMYTSEHEKPTLFAAHARTDREYTQEEIQHDLDFMNNPDIWK